MPLSVVSFERPLTSMSQQSRVFRNTTKTAKSITVKERKNLFEVVRDERLAKLQ
jgi:hypothetical protein